MSLKQKIFDYFSETIIGEPPYFMDGYEDDLNGISFEHKNWLIQHIDDTILLNEIHDTETEPEGETLFSELAKDIEVKQPISVENINNLDGIIKKYLENEQGLSWFMKSSVESYAASGRVSGTLKLQLKAMLNEFAGT